MPPTVQAARAVVDVGSGPLFKTPDLAAALETGEIRALLETLPTEALRNIANIAHAIESERAAPSNWPGLSRRQAQVADLLREGIRDREIAERLQCSLNTARVHVGAVLKRLGVSSRRALIDGRLDRYAHKATPPVDHDAASTPNTLEAVADALGFVKLSSRGRRALPATDRQRFAELIEDAESQRGPILPPNRFRRLAE